MSLVKYFLILFSCCLLVFSCDNKKEEKKKTINLNSPEIDKSLEKANRYLFRTEEEQIDDYVRRHKLEMIETGTGLRYQIVKEGDGEKVTKGKKITIALETYFITGDLVYSEEKTFEVGKGGVESGIEEAILLMKKGDVAKIILPSHLAFGVLGDQNKIPSRVTLVYKLKIIDLH